MFSLLSRWSFNKLNFLGAALILLGCGGTTNKTTERVLVDIKVDTISTFNAYKLELTKKYCQQYYGFNDYKLNDPKMIVIHYTVIPTLKETIALFKNNNLASNRSFINKFSALNVGIHYVVDKDGCIYNLAPDSIITRHLIGFNHVSIGIENISKNEDELTPLQLESNAKLIAYLSNRYASINYLIGHHEYNNQILPHYALFKSLDCNYQPYEKFDPGEAFMYYLRKKLLIDYGLEFQK